MATGTLETRKKNTDGKIRQLLSLYCENKHLLTCKFNNNVTLHAKTKAWQAITSAVNSDNVDKRTIKYRIKAQVERLSNCEQSQKRPVSQKPSPN